MHTSSTPSEPLEVFISYASKDEDLVKEFKPHLEALERQQGIKTFYGIEDGELGRPWRDELRQHINSSQLILLLVSKHFLASECCYEFELKLAMERYEIGAARVVSIILSSSNWIDTKLGDFPALPRGGKAIDTSKNTNDALTSVTREISELVKKLKGPIEPMPTPRETPIAVRRRFPAGKYAVIVAAAVVIALTSLFSFRGYFPWARLSGGEGVHIEVTDLPPYDPVGGTTSHGHIAGTASGASSPKFSIVIYSFTNEWYVQPSTADPETTIGSDGRWSADIKTGTKYTVLLVPRNYQPPSPIPTNPTRLNGVVTSIEFEGKR